MINNLQSDQKKIVYEDENIVVVYKSGSSDFILCTFGDLMNLAEGDKIYAESAINKLDYAAIGFMAKSPNWFPADSLVKSICEVKYILRDYNDIVSYGGSMGGYAAIKYSKLLEATHTIACCPQWSIDPEECNGRVNGYEKYYKPQMLNMGIKTDDMFGHVFILYDPCYDIDSFHFEQIKRQFDNVTGMPIAYVGHHVTAVMAGTENLRKMIESVRILDDRLLARIINDIRRKSRIRYEYLLKDSVIKHPYLTAKIILRVENKTPNIPNVLNILNKAISLLVNNGESRKLLELVNLSLEGRCSENKKLMQEVTRRIEISLVNKAKIYTYHNTILYYNVFTSMLCHEKEGGKLSSLMILREVHSVSFSGEEYLAVSSEDGNKFINFEQNTIFLSETVSDYSIKREIYGDGKYFFVCKNKYMCAEPNGSLPINRDSVNAWELFVN